MVDSDQYYATYHGHEVNYISAVSSTLKKEKESLIYLVGDSSFDNKYWFDTQADAVNGYEKILKPPRSKCDVTYHMNRELAERAPKMAVVNTAVEATTLNNRSLFHLLPQDAFVRDNIGKNDILVVSIGGNDIALAPVLCTCVNIVPLLCAGACCGDRILDMCSFSCAPDIYTPTGGCMDCGCCACGLPGCLTGLFACPPGLGYFSDLFGNRVRSYVSKLVTRTKPKLIIVCMIYYLDVHGKGSWADATLKLLCYDTSPHLLQHAIRNVYEHGTKRIRINGTRVLPFPLFSVLDGSDTSDYVSRVEPSVRGGAKMAKALVDAILLATSNDKRSPQLQQQQQQQQQPAAQNMMHH